MIPLRDVIPGRTTPWVTIALIAANLIVFLYELLAQPRSDQTLPRFFDDVGLPARFTWLTALTGVFLHANWLHLGSNLLALWIFGDNVEDRTGHGRFALFYLLAAVAGGLAEAVARPGALEPVVVASGASGAIAGVMGAYLVLFPTSRILVLIPLVAITEIIEIPAVFIMLVWLTLQMLSGVGRLESGVGEGLALWAHAGGLLAGLAGVWIFRRRERLRVEWWGK